MKIRPRGLWLPLLGWLAGLPACILPFGPSADQPPAQVEQDIFNRINEHRRSIGAGTLVWNDIIAGQARRHSQDIADGKVGFGHDGFDQRTAAIGATIPWRSAGEVVALAGSAAETVNGWLASPEHKSILEGDFALTGVGVVKNKSGTAYYTTQIFIKPF